MFGFFSEKWDPKGKHCYITGGSSGLGLSLALQLAAKGAHVSIAARDESKLASALQQLNARRLNTLQRMYTISADLRTAKGSTLALEEVAEHGGEARGEAPDVVFTCAGRSRPGFWVEMGEEEMREGMDYTYWVQAWTAWAASKMMVQQKRKGKIVFVASVLGYMSFVGYSSYAPGKHALRGLADTLRSELMLYDINVHIYFPPTIHSPGLAEENARKPKVTLQIEEDDVGVTPEDGARILLQGIAAGHTHITGDMISDIFRASTQGSAPGHNFMWDSVLDFIGRVGIPIWLSGVDSKVRAHRAEHASYLDDRGFRS